MSPRARILTIAALMSLLSAPSAWSQPAAKTLTPQQQRMAACSSANKGKTGDDYKSSVSQCLKGNAASSKTLTPQQQLMKDCNARASEQALTGDKRKAYMSTCLKSSKQ